MIVKKFSGVESIKIEASVKVAIVKAQEFQVSVSGDDAEKVKIQQLGAEIEINYSEAGGNNVMSFSNESFTIGNVSDPAKKPVEIEIQCPDGLSIDCTLMNDAILGAFPEFNRARIAIKGSGDAGIQSKSGKLKINGSGDITYKSLGGNLKMTIAGSGDIKASGSFNDVEAFINGSGNIQTSGNVNGDYEADISGVGNIRHSGQIFGRKNKSISGMGKVKW